MGELRHFAQALSDVRFKMEPWAKWYSLRVAPSIRQYKNKLLALWYVLCFQVISMSAIYTLQRQGYSVPRDVSVVGWCNSDLATLAKPMLTSVRVPLFDLGFSSVAALDRCINGLPQGNIVYNSSIVLRESTSIRAL